MHIAIVGCGQLSQMLAQAGIPLGHRFTFVADPEEDIRCVDNLGDVVRYLPGTSVETLYDQLGRPDRITVEKEQVELQLIEELEKHCPVQPNPTAFAACQHRYREKQLLDRLQIPSAEYVYGQPSDAQAAGLSLPVVVKSCRDGYDGKNQWVLKTPQDVANFSPEQRDEHYIVEKWIPFEREVSQLSVRSISGEIKHYPLVQNLHENGILRQTLAPAPDIPDELVDAAQAYISKIMIDLNYVGVMAMECFLLADAKLLVNELAPRVHNSGHWTQAGETISQFENHIRAVAEQSLKSTVLDGSTGMVNLIGVEKPDENSFDDSVTVHWYGKVVRPGRKLGHINVQSADLPELRDKMQALLVQSYNP